MDFSNDFHGEAAGYKNTQQKPLLGVFVSK